MNITVYLAEKESAAKAIAEAIDIDTSIKNTDGFFEKIDGGKTIVAYTNGHLLCVKEPYQINTEYQKWRLDMLPIRYSLNAEYLSIIDSKRTLYRKVKRVLSEADNIILAGDAGREGELIQRWVLANINIKNKYIGRLWTQSLTSTAIKKAIDNIYVISAPDNVELNDAYLEKTKYFSDLYAAGEARAYMDAILGFNYSRAITLAKTDGITAVYGRCQSPLTNEIIKRDEEIASFKEEPYSYIVGLLEQDGIYLTLVNDNEEKVIYKNKEDAERTLKLLPGKVNVLEVNKTEKIKHPEKPFDILTLQKEMARKYDFTADKTLKICQELYDEYHMLSYPRTDSRYYTNDLVDEIKEVISKLAFGKFEKVALAGSISDIPKRYINDKKVGDHHALMPVVDNINIEDTYIELSPDERKVFDAICENFISLHLPDYIYDEIKIICEAKTDENCFRFISKGKSNKDKGFTAYFAKDEDEELVNDDKEDNMDLSYISEGNMLHITPKVINTVTKPKKHYTTESLLNLMKVYNIGTGATRDSIIRELILPKGKNKESSVKKEGRYYIATEFGKEIDKLIPEELKKVEYLSSLDNKLKEIEEGKLTEEKFIDELQEEVKENINKLKAEAGINRLTYRDDEMNLKCPICGNKMVEKKDFYGCVNYRGDSPCKFTISKTFRGKKLSQKNIEDLVTKKKTRKLKFVSEKGINYEAYVVLKDNNGKYKLDVEFN